MEIQTKVRRNKRMPRSIPFHGKNALIPVFILAAFIARVRFDERTREGLRPGRALHSRLSASLEDGDDDTGRALFGIAG
jgi:hypothetical protein